MSRRTSEKGIALIKSFEGCHLTAYKCVPTETYWTIGWGHYGADVKEGMKITQVEADRMFLEDIKHYENYVNNKSYVPLTDSLNQNQFDALVSFCYNCGCGNLKKLCTGKTLDQIARDIPLYNKSGGNVLKGLVRRRAEEVELFNTPFATPSNKKSNEEIAREVIAGKWGNGESRKKKLSEAGYNYSEVQNIVNNLLKPSKPSNKKSNEEIAREVIKGKWGNGEARKKKLSEAGYNYSEVQSIVNKLLK